MPCVKPSRKGKPRARSEGKTPSARGSRTESRAFPPNERQRRSQHQRPFRFCGMVPRRAWNVFPASAGACTVPRCPTGSPTHRPGLPIPPRARHRPQARHRQEPPIPSRAAKRGRRRVRTLPPAPVERGSPEGATVRGERCSPLSWLAYTTTPTTTPTWSARDNAPAYAAAMRALTALQHGCPHRRNHARTAAQLDARPTKQ